MSASEIQTAINVLSGCLAGDLGILKQHLVALPQDLAESPRRAQARFDEIQTVASSISPDRQGFGERVTEG